MNKQKLLLVWISLFTLATLLQPYFGFIIPTKLAKLDNPINSYIAKANIIPVPSCTDECSYYNQRTCIDSTHYKVCGNYDADNCLEWSTIFSCPQGQVCSNGQCINQYVYHDYKACHNNDVYWYDSNSQRQDKAQECGNSYCNSWQANYCQGNSVYHQKTCYLKGCSNGACYSTPYTEKELVQQCSKDQVCQNGQCITSCTNECSSIGQTQVQCSGNYVQQRTCGNYDTDPCLEWSSWSSTSNCDNYDGCSGTTYYDYSCSNGACIYQTSLNDSRCTPSCSNDCSTIGQRTCIDSTHYKVCGNYDADNCLEWSSPEICSGPTNCGYGICASNQRPNWYCSDGSCIYNCTYDSSCETQPNYLSCYNNDVWWFSSRGSLLSKYQECGDSYCNNWQPNYCVGNKIYHRRNCYSKGCSNGSCYSTTYNDAQLVKECRAGQTCQDGQCVNKQECTSGPCCEQGHYKPSTAICNVETKTQYGCPWGLGCGSDVGKRVKSRFQYCSGNSAQCNGKWSNWGDWTNWTVSDYCSNNEYCMVGQSRCQYSSNCTQPSGLIQHYKKGCYNNNVYWFNSNSIRQEKYKDCNDKNDCTIDSCDKGRCSNILKCDGSTCAIGSTDYCNSCNHCGDKVCNCNETICNCPQDCQTSGLGISLLAKKENSQTQWKDQLDNLRPNENLDVLAVISNNGQKTLDNIEVKMDLPQGIIYKDFLNVEKGSYLGDIKSGLNIGKLNPGENRIISFRLGIKSGIAKPQLDLIVTASAQDISASDAVKLSLKTIPLGAGIGFGLRALIKHWYLWLMLTLASMSLLFLGGFYLLYWLIKRRQERETASNI